MAFVALGTTQNESELMYEKFGNSEDVITALENKAAERNIDFHLQEGVNSVLYELRSAAKAYIDWQPSKVCKSVNKLIFFFFKIIRAVPH